MVKNFKKGTFLVTSLRIISEILIQIISDYHAFEVVQFTTNKRGNPQVIDESGFAYSKHVVSKGIIYWRCMRKSPADNRYCTTRVGTEGNRIVKRSGNHNHHPELKIKY